MKKMIRKYFTYLLFINVSAITLQTVPAAVLAATKQQQNQTELSLKSFIEQASIKDIQFEAILIEQLPLQYRRELLLPDSDVIMDIKYQYNFYLNQDRNNPEASLSLSKLFPYNGTEVSLSYGKASSIFSPNEESGLELLISQPIANNAFGKATQLQDKIIGIENDISRYQIIEAYEDYLAGLTTVYYNWYSAYENLRLSRSSYQSSQKLMQNILERQQQKIALPIDVNKMKLLLTGKQENIIVLEEIYQSYANLITKSIDGKANLTYVPAKPAKPSTEILFRQDYEAFTRHSRTYKILNKLQQQDILSVEKAADELLPSTRLLLGYKQAGQDWNIEQQKDDLFAGIELNWPIGRSVNKAKKQLAKIEQEKRLLTNKNKYEELRINLKNLFLQIQREKKLIEISERKIRLAQAILKDEAENYSFGKITLNDYIAAVNSIDEIRFSHTEHSVELNKLLTEWLRLTDKLVDEKILQHDSKNGLPEVWKQFTVKSQK